MYRDSTSRLCVASAFASTRLPFSNAHEIPRMGIAINTTRQSNPRAFHASAMSVSMELMIADDGDVARFIERERGRASQIS
jgi:hypothetical protein